MDVAVAHRVTPAAVTVERPRLTAAEQRRLARGLVEAAQGGRPVPPLTERHPDLTIEDAQRIRDLLLAHRLAGGERLVGAKVLLPAAAPAQQASAEPALGWLTDGMLLPAGVVNVGELISPRVEPRLAVRLEHPLRGSIRTASDLLAAAVEAHLALEIVDSRYDRDSLGPADHIADNCSAARLLIGPGVLPPAEGSLRRMRVHLDVEAGGGGIRESALTPSLSPLDALVWLADRLTRSGRTAIAGAVLVAPAGVVSADLRPGVRVRAYDRELGSLELWG